MSLVKWLYYFGFLPALSLLRPAQGLGIAGRLGPLKNPDYSAWRKAVAHSLSLARPEIPASNRPAIAQDLTALGIWEEAETFQYPRWTSQNIQEHFSCEGLDHLAGCLRQGRGAIIMASHFGLYCSGWIALGLKGFATVFLASDSPNDPRFASPMQRHSRLKINRMKEIGQGRCALVDLNRGLTMPVVRELRKALEHNETVGIVLDVPPQMATATETAEFLGLSCRFPVGLFRLAYLSGAPVLPMLCPVEGGCRKIFIEPPLSLTGDLRIDLQTGVSLFERYVRRYPGQWFLWDALPHFLTSTEAPSLHPDQEQVD